MTCVIPCSMSEESICMKGSLFVASCILSSVTEDKEFTMAAMVGSKFASVSACLGGLYHRLMRELCIWIVRSYGVFVVQIRHQLYHLEGSVVPRELVQQGNVIGHRLLCA